MGNLYITCVYKVCVYRVYNVCIRCVYRVCVQLALWVNEKMLTAQDLTYDEARNLHSKWLKHQAFMAELQANKEWLEKIEKVGPLPPVTHQ